MIDAFKMYLFPCIINTLTVIYMISRITGKKFDFKKIKNYIAIVLLIIITIFNYIVVKDFMRMVTIVPIVCLFNKYIYRGNVNASIISVIVEQIVLIVSEMLFIAGTIIFLGANGEIIINSYYGQLFANTGISIVAIVLVNFPFIRNLYKKLLLITKKLSLKTIIYIVTITLVVVNILIVCIYREISILQVLLINLLFFAIYGFISYRILVEKSISAQIQAENKALVDNLNEYENLLDYQRVANHENKNQLLVIQSMLSKKDKKISDYIDEIVKEKREDNELLYTEAKRIPSGGLQGIIYQKMLKMNDKGIKADLNISRNIRNIDFSNIEAKLNYDLCRIIGVLLDNSIDATEKLNKEQKEIGISMYYDDEFLCVEISNCFDETLDLERIDEKGYTTKGKGHGYGLSLVKEIINKNKSVINERAIMQDVFTQIIKVKI